MGRESDTFPNFQKLSRTKVTGVDGNQLVSFWIYVVFFLRNRQYGIYLYVLLCFPYKFKIPSWYDNKDYKFKPYVNLTRRMTMVGWVWMSQESRIESEDKSHLRVIYNRYTTKVQLGIYTNV